MDIPITVQQEDIEYRKPVSVSPHDHGAVQNTGIGGRNRYQVPPRTFILRWRAVWRAALQVMTWHHQAFRQSGFFYVPAVDTTQLVRVTYEGPLRVTRLTANSASFSVRLIEHTDTES